MKFRKTLAIAVTTLATLATLGAGGGAFAATLVNQAPPRGTFESVVNQGTAIYGNCTVTARTTTTYYHWSSTKGWVQYPAPKITTSQTTVCHTLKG
jgi:hypothetical protein